MAGHVPAVWIRNRYSAQQKPWRNDIRPCLAHLGPRRRFRVRAWARVNLPFRFKLWLGKGVAWPEPWRTSRPSTLRAGKSESWKAARAFSGRRPTRSNLGPTIASQKIGRARNQLLTFCDYPGEVDRHQQYVGAQAPTVRGCQPKKSPTATRAMWAAEAEAEYDNHRHRQGSGPQPLNVSSSKSWLGQEPNRQTRRSKIGVGNYHRPHTARRISSGSSARNPGH